MRVTEERILEAVLRREGGFVDHPADRGGPTKYGVTQDTLSAWRGAPATPADVAGISAAEARRIYQKLYIEGPGFDRIVDDRLRMLVVDCAVNHGPARAARWLQEAAGADVDGIFGPLTAGAVNGAETGAVYRRLLAARCRFYGRLIAGDRSQAAFAAGWTARLAEFIEEQA